MAETKKYIVRGIEKKQQRDKKGRFLPKREKYITKSCPKVEYSFCLEKAKLYSSYAKANYALHGINERSEKIYEFEVIPVTFMITVKE